MRKPYLILIRGPCGVGKSTVSKAFAKKHGLALLEIDTFVFDIHRRKKLLAADRTLIEKNVNDVGANYVKAGRSLIIEGAMVRFGGTKVFNIDSIVKLASKKKYRIVRIVLTADKTACFERMKARNFMCKKSTVDGIWKAIQIDSNGYEPINTTKLSVDKTIKTIESLL